MQGSPPRMAFPTNLLGKGISLADLVEWKIQAERKQKRLKEDMLIKRLQDDYPPDKQTKPNMYIKTNFSTKNLTTAYEKLEQQRDQIKTIQDEVNDIQDKTGSGGQLKSPLARPFKRRKAPQLIIRSDQGQEQDSIVKRGVKLIIGDEPKAKFKPLKVTNAYNDGY